MKKKYIMYAGIISAVLLVIMFACILMTGSFTIFSSATIDPIPDHAAGDLVVITGSTNLPADTRLVLDILVVSPDPGTNSYVGGTDAFIVRGGGMSNTWSGALDSSAIPPGEYQANAYWLDEKYSRSSLLATSRFRLTNTTPDPDRIVRRSANHKLEFITIDRPGVIYRGEKILISGTTNLPNDTVLLYTITQQSNTSVFTMDPKTQKQDLRGGFTRSGLITLQQGDNGVSRWSFAVDSTEFIPDHYEVIVTPVTTRTVDIGRVGTFGREPLTVLEATSDRLTSQVPVTGPCQTITIAALPDTLTNQTYTITGTTSLQPGTELLFQILPTEFDSNINRETKGFSGSITGAMGTVEVIRGTGEINTWSANFDLSKFPPKEYLMNISNDRIDPRTYETIYGDTYCSKRFTLSG
jgi:hypothetical protein